MKAEITEFNIKNLHGKKDVNIRFKDNTLILVGENGTGKTTCLHLFFYFISGQWAALARYDFSELSIRINDKEHKLTKRHLTKSIQQVDPRFLRRLPLSERKRIYELIESKGTVASQEQLHMIADRYGIPVDFLLTEYDLFEDEADSHGSSAVMKALKEVKESLGSQILYLPTYRRIEQELQFIFKDMEDSELGKRRGRIGLRRERKSYLELVEFGMKDVENALKSTQRDLDMFARRSLTDLTFGFLGDIVGHAHESLDLNSIIQASPEMIGSVLDRVHNDILPAASKNELKQVIRKYQNTGDLTESSRVTCYYFSQLLEFHKKIEAQESNLRKFCQVCNKYMADKKYRYDTTDFSAKIFPNREDVLPEDEIALSSLSSGEKQIVSLFSHLYLSGEKNYFVLIDEPELSLSVPWQRKFLVDIRDAGLCTGLFAVTHSPFIYENGLEKYAHGMGEFIR